MHRRQFLLASLGTALAPGDTVFDDRSPQLVNRFGEAFWAWQEGNPKERRHFLPAELYRRINGGSTDPERQYRYYSTRAEALEGLAFGRRMVEELRRSRKP